MGFGSANIGRCYAGQQLIAQLSPASGETRQNKWWKTHPFLDLFVQLSFRTAGYFYESVNFESLLISLVLLIFSGIFMIYIS